MANFAKNTVSSTDINDVKWTKSLKKLSEIGSNTVGNFLDKTGKKELGPKGYKLFVENYIHDVYTASLPADSTDTLVKARCFRTQRKNEHPHSLQIIIDKHGKGHTASCSCKAGSGGHCNHVLGLLHLLCHWSLLRVSEIPADKTCTSLPQQWSKPRPNDKIEPEPVMKSVFVKSSKEKRKRDPISCKLYNANRKKMKENEISNITTSLNQEKRKPPFSYLLSDQNCSQTINTVFGNVPLGSYLGYQLFDEKKSKINFVLNRLESEVESINQQPGSVLPFPDIPLQMSNTDDNEFERLISQRSDEEKKFLERLKVSINQAHNIQLQTVQQSQCAEWHKHRQHRLTASNFGRILIRKNKPTEAFLNSLFQQKDLSRVEAIKHGKQHEAIARSIYSRKMQKKVNKLFTVYECGLSISPLYPHLGASPDGKVFDPTERNHFGLLEIKCPFKWRNKSMSESCEDPTFHCQVVNGKVCLKQAHADGYYAQVQGQLLLTGLTWCDFVVYLSVSKCMNVERIYYDNDYCHNYLLPKLNDLYFKHAIEYFVNDD